MMRSLYVFSTVKCFMNDSRDFFLRFLSESVHQVHLGRKLCFHFAETSCLHIFAVLLWRSHSVPWEYVWAVGCWNTPCFEGSLTLDQDMIKTLTHDQDMLSSLTPYFSLFVALPLCFSWDVFSLFLTFKNHFINLYLLWKTYTILLFQLRFFTV